MQCVTARATFIPADGTSPITVPLGSLTETTDGKLRHHSIRFTQAACNPMREPAFDLGREGKLVVEARRNGDDEWRGREFPRLLVMYRGFTHDSKDDNFVYFVSAKE